MLLHCSRCLNMLYWKLYIDSPSNWSWFFISFPSSWSIHRIRLFFFAHKIHELLYLLFVRMPAQNTLKWLFYFVPLQNYLIQTNLIVVELNNMGLFGVLSLFMYIWPKIQSVPIEIFPSKTHEYINHVPNMSSILKTLTKVKRLHFFPRFFFSTSDFFPSLFVAAYWKTTNIK